MDFIIVAIFGLGFGFVLPIWAARSANKKGRKGWAIATIVAMFVGAGWLVGIFAVMQPHKLSGTELEVACPDCSGTEGFSHIGLVNKKTGQQTVSLIATIISTLIALVLIGGAAAMAISIWMEGDDGMIQWEYGSTIAGLGVLILGISFGRFFVAPIMEYPGAERVHTDIYKCSNCDREWNEFEQQDGEFIPSQLAESQ